MKVCVASNLNSNHPMQKGWSGGTMEFEPQTNPIWLVGKNAQSGEWGREPSYVNL
jgi:hypothetical protein